MSIINNVLLAIGKVLIKCKKTFFTKSFARFCVLGTINCFNDSLFSWLAGFILQKNLAAMTGYLISLSIAYLLTSRFIFTEHITFSSYIKFLLSYIPNFIIFSLITFITINTWHLHQFIGTFLAAMAGGPVTFILIKSFAFKE